MSPSDEDVKESEAEATEQASGRRTVLIVTVAAVVVLVVAGVVIYLLTSGDDSADNASDGKDVPTISGSAAPTTESTGPGATVAPPATATGATGAPEPPAAGDVAQAESLAEEAVTAISGADVDKLNQLACDQSNPATEDTFPADAKAKVVGEPKIVGDTATVDIELTIANSEPTVVPMPLTKQGGRWCIPA